RVRPRNASAPDSGHQFFDLRFQIGGKRKEWEASWAAIVTVQVHCVFHTGNSDVADDSLGSQFDSFLFFTGQRDIVIFDGGVDLVTRHGRWRSECNDGSDGAQGQ